MNQAQQDRFNDLQEQAINDYLNDTDFSVVDYLDEDEAKEYCELYNLQFEEKNCLCGQHTDWQ